MSEMDREQLEAMEHGEYGLPKEKPYVPRPKYQLVLAWIAIGIVAFAFAGTVYWMINFVP